MNKSGKEVAPLVVCLDEPTRGSKDQILIECKPQLEERECMASNKNKIWNEKI